MIPINKDIMLDDDKIKNKREGSKKTFFKKNTSSESLSNN